MATLSAQALDKAEQRKERRGPRWGLAWILLPVSALVAMLLVFVMPPGDSFMMPSGDLDHNVHMQQTKGRTSLHVFARQGGVIKEVSSGDILRAGDAVRFRFSTAHHAGQPRFVAVMGIDSQARVSRYVPARDDKLVPLSAARDGAFPVDNSIILDQTGGQEIFVGLLCTRALSVDMIQLGLERFVPMALAGQTWESARELFPECELLYLSVRKGIN